MTPLEGVAHQIALEARVAANCANSAVPGWGYSVAVPEGLFLCKTQKVERILSYPSRNTVAAELVRIDLDFLDEITDTSALKLLLRKELEPFIIGVGEIRAIESAKGLIVARMDQG